MNQRLLVSLISLCLFVMVYLLVTSIINRKELESLKAHLKNDTDTESEHFELAESMGNVQRYFNKLWFAGNNANWELASFYVHEIEEVFESIEGAQVVDEGKDISALVKMMAEPGIKSLEEGIGQVDTSAFKENYMIMMNACNSCHAVAGHAFIQIKLPETPAFDNQVY